MTQLNTQETAIVRRRMRHCGPAGPVASQAGRWRCGRRAVPGWAPLAVCCLAQFMVVLDISIVNVALPQMKAGLHLSPGGQQWVINAYTLTFAGLLMLAAGPPTCSAAGGVPARVGLFTGSACLAGWRRTGRG